MSTNEDEVRIKVNKDKKPNEINVQIDSQVIEDLATENADLKTKLQLIAEKEFSAQLKRFHLPEGSTPEDLKQAMSLEKKEARGGDTLSWSQNIQEKDEDPRAQKDLSSILVDDTKQGLENAISFLNFKKKSGTQAEKEEARKLLAVAEKRIFSKNKQLLDVEFSDDIHALTRHEISIPSNASPEEAQKIEAYNAELRRKRANWIQRE